MRLLEGEALTFDDGETQFEDSAGLEPEDIRDGMEVIYFPSPSIACHGFVDGKPWKLGGHTWVVRLKNMDPSYAAKTGKLGGRDFVNAAALHRLSIP